MLESWLLDYRQNLPLDLKIDYSKKRIRDWYEFWEGKVYVSFSGGKDSTVLLHLVREIYPNIKAVFVDTGLEYPEIRDFVKTIDNVIWLKPKLSFYDVIKKYGYPIISKEQAQYIDQYRTAKSEKTKNTRWNGHEGGQGKISEKWKYLLDAPFKISARCCDFIKKNPVKKFEKETELKPFLGVMAADSSKRKQDYIKYGCNSFESKRPISRPIGFWTDKDIWDYIKLKELKYSKIYDMGFNNTDCVFCAFGVHLEKNNKFDIMENTHPKLYNYCMNKLNMREVLQWYIGEKSNSPEKFKDLF